MNGLNMKVDVKAIPLGSYDCLIGVNWMEKHHVVLDYYNKTITCLDEEVKQGKIQGIPRVVVVRDIVSIRLKNTFRKRCQMFASHMEEVAKDKVERIEDHLVFKDFDDVFREILGFPPTRGIDFYIDLVSRASLVSKPQYKIGRQKFKELQMQLEEIFKKEYIHPSVSPWGSLVIILKKKDITLRMCIDLRHVNKVTIKSKYPSPKIYDLFDQRKGARIFSNIDLRSGYHQVRIKEEDIIKTMLRTRYGHYEFMVVPFGLSNDPIFFMCFMNGVFREYLDKFVIMFLDDILAYSKSEEEHEKHLIMGLQGSREDRLYANISKFIFYKKKIHYLGNIISVAEVEVDPEKMKSITGWIDPKSVKKVISFMGIFGYY
jgi:hypothetical protein